MQYRPEVDGLRALAVIAVLLFHAGFQHFAGGFVGVDVFFVISGFLITGIIKADLDEGRFSLFHFYERRVRRIIPALMTVIVACLVAGVALFLPYQLRDLGLSALSAIAFASNIWFWKQSGYFAGDSSLQPLLHTWSLGVEEQFYLFFPLGIALLARLKVPLLPVVLAIFVVSLLGSEYLVHRAPSATFYLLPTRAWELMLGATLALRPLRPGGGETANDVTAGLGLALIGYAVVAYSSRTAFPGLSAVPPCLGSFLVIAASQRGGGRVTRLLGSRVPVGIGLISYSLYLWHWPLLVFARQWRLTEPLGLGFTWLLLGLSFALAYLSWRFVEIPLRSRAAFPRRALFRAAFAMSALATASAAVVSTGLAARFTASERALSAGKNDRSPVAFTCLSADAAAGPCHLGAAGPPSYAVWGDSHAAAMAEAIAAVGSRSHRSGLLFAFNACAPGIGGPSPDLPDSDRAACLEHNRRAITRMIADPTIGTVLLVAYWQIYLEKAPKPLMSSLAATIPALRRSGKQVVILAGLPVPGYDVPHTAALSLYFGRPMPRSASPPALPEPLRALAGRTGARLIPLAPAFCNPECRVTDGAHTLYFDSNHVTAYADRNVLAPYLGRQGLFGSP